MCPESHGGYSGAFAFSANSKSGLYEAMKSVNYVTSMLNTWHQGSADDDVEDEEWEGNNHGAILSAQQLAEYAGTELTVL